MPHTDNDVAGALHETAQKAKSSLHGMTDGTVQSWDGNEFVFTSPEPRGFELEDSSC